MHTRTRPYSDEHCQLWAPDRAERLRAMARMRPNQPIDRQRVTEEMEDLGRRPQDCPCPPDQVLGGWLPERHPD